MVEGPRSPGEPTTMAADEGERHAAPRDAGEGGRDQGLLQVKIYFQHR